jgi:integrase
VKEDILNSNEHLVEIKNIKESNRVTELRAKSKIRFTVESHRYKKEVRGGDREKRVALILLKNIESGKELIHPFTEFIMNFKAIEIKSQIDYGRDICTFLNYILDNQRQLNISNFTQLEYYHASYFINYYCGNLARGTAIRYKNIISKFYYFLATNSFTVNCEPEDFTIREAEGRNGRIIKTIEAPFPDLDLPEAKDTSRNEHDMTHELQAFFLEVAYEEVNRIALGVALQMFGGLRMSEVIRLRYSLIRTYGHYGEQGILLVLKDDDEGTRPELKNNQGKGYVKRPRIQEAISPNGLISELLKQHSLKYKEKGGSDAIFINSENKAMSYKSYQYYFGILKKKFLKRLGECENPVLKMQKSVLESRRWFTHIGRGIFSNNLVEIVDNPVVAQLLRGDKNINSIGIYIGNSKRLGKQFEENTEDTYRELITKIRS